ncbi:MAG: tetratricopeptide repeat protein [Rubrivivax sp.]
MATAAAALALSLLAGCATKEKKFPGDDAPTIATLAARSVEIPADRGIASNEAQAMTAYRAFLDVAKDAPQRPEVMRRLADLEMDLADRKAGDAGATPDYKAAVAQYEKVLKEHPNAAGNDRVLYQIARAQEQGGDLDAALKTLTRIARDYPDTIHRDEVHFRRGELLFATRDYVGAGDAYATVLRSTALTPFTERALYMRGWSLFKQGKLEDALEPFFKVLDLKLGSRPSPGPDPLAHLTRADRELLEDTHRVMSLALANLEGAASIGKYVTSKDPADMRRGYEHRVYVELAELYLKQDRPKDAADTLAFYARLRPLATPAPELLARVIEIHESKGFPTLALDAKRDFVSRYGRTSEFRQANAAGWAAAQPRVKAHLVELARHHHAAAQQTKSREDLQQAVRWYRELLTAFPDDAEVVAQRFLLAELLFEDRQFPAAVVEYETVAYGAPVNAGARRRHRTRRRASRPHRQRHALRLRLSPRPPTPATPRCWPTPSRARPHRRRPSAAHCSAPAWRARCASPTPSRPTRAPAASPPLPPRRCSLSVKPSAPAPSRGGPSAARTSPSPSSARRGPSSR